MFRDQHLAVLLEDCNYSITCFVCTSFRDSITPIHVDEHNYNKTDSADHVISTGHQMMNLVSSFECLFDFFQPTLKSDVKEVQLTQNIFFIIPWRCPKFHDSATVKKHNNDKYFKFETNFVI